MKTPQPHFADTVDQHYQTSLVPDSKSWNNEQTPTCSFEVMPFYLTSSKCLCMVVSLLSNGIVRYFNAITVYLCCCKTTSISVSGINCYQLNIKHYKCSSTDKYSLFL